MKTSRSQRLRKFKERKTFIVFDKQNLCCKIKSPFLAEETNDARSGEKT